MAVRTMYKGIFVLYLFEMAHVFQFFIYRYEMVSDDRTGCKVYSAGFGGIRNDEATEVHARVRGEGEAGGAEERQDDPADRAARHKEHPNWVADQTAPPLTGQSGATLLGYDMQRLVWLNARGAPT